MHAAKLPGKRAGGNISPGLNALLSVVAREQKKQSGEHLCHTSEGKEAAEAEEEGLSLRAVSSLWGAAPARCVGGGGGSSPVVQQSVPPLPFLPSRAKDLKTRLGILLHKPELGHRIGTSSKLQLGSRRR